MKECLPLLQYMPLSEGFHDRRTLESHEFALSRGWPSQLEQLERADTEFEFARIAASRRSARANRFNSDLENKLRNSVYIDWTSRMPPLCDVPQIDRYRNKTADTPRLLAELSSLPTLAPGQFLFHGGKWPGNLSIGSVVTVDKPFSTTLSAFPAAWFADEAVRRFSHDFHLWVIHTEPGFSASVYVYNIFRNRISGHEAEVLLESGFTATLRNFTKFNGFTLLEVSFG